MCNNNEYVNIKSGETLDLERVNQLKSNAMLKVMPELWSIWDFEKNIELGLDVWKVTKGSDKKAWWYCDKYNDSYPMPISKKTSGRGCSICSGYYIVFANSLALLNPTLASQWHPTKNKKTPYDFACNSNQKIWWQCKNNHYWEATINSRTDGKGCPYCAGRKVWIGFNDMWTTNPELASMLLNPEDGYKFMQFSGEKADWKCPNCDSIIKDKAIRDVNTQRLSCSSCSDGVSFPEKVMYNLLKFIDINFVVEKTFHWEKKRRYDFYIPSLNLIIETHGGQHYINSNRKGSRTLEEEQANDKYKYEMAIGNGVKEYITIDCRKSDFEFIKNNILNSKLTEIFDLSKVDWDVVLKSSLKSINIMIVDLWKSGVSADEISKKMRLKKTSVYKTIRDMSKVGICLYSRSRIFTDISNKVYQFDLDYNLIKVWDSIKTIVESLNLEESCINRCCNGKQKTSYGYIWKYEKENNKDEEDIV